MNFTMPMFSVAMPEIFLLCMIGFILLVDVFVKERFRVLTFYLVQATLIATFVMVAFQYDDYPTAIVTFNGNYALDKLAVLVKLFVLLTSFFTFIYSGDYIKSRGMPRSDYYILGLLAVLGMLIMASAYSFLTIYLGLELLSLALYAMVALNKKSAIATEAAMKFFVMGAFASGLLLYGISMIYGSTGTIIISDIPNAVSLLSHNQELVLLLGLVFVLSGLLFKFGAVPFHMWVPDVYDGAPTPVTLFIASAPKVAAFGITMRVLVQALPALVVEWQHYLIVIAILSMFFGNVLAIAQTNIKRMLAYSSISHIGYMLLGIIAGPNSGDGYSAAMFYIATYVFVAAGAFAIITYMSRGGVELDKLNDYRGLNARNPWLAFMMLLLMFSMAGVPPTVGFFAKLGLLEALVEAHYVWLAALALVFAIIGAYYYIRIVMYMYFEEPPETMLDSHITMSPGMLTAITINGVAALALGLLPSTLIDMCRISVG